MKQMAATTITMTINMTSRFKIVVLYKFRQKEKNATTVSFYYIITVHQKDPIEIEHN